MLEAIAIWATLLLVGGILVDAVISIAWHPLWCTLLWERWQARRRR